MIKYKCWLYRPRLLGLAMGILIALSFLNYVNNIKLEQYISGYSSGWQESRFIDCTNPDVNQDMQVSFSLDDGKRIRYEYWEWEEVCEKLFRPREGFTVAYWINKDTLSFDEPVDDVEINIYFESKDGLVYKFGDREREFEEKDKSTKEDEKYE